MRVRDFQNGSETPYAYLRRILAHRNEMTICNNTRAIVNFDVAVTVTLHGNVILTAYYDGLTIVRDGGWQTATTKDRLNRVLPLSVRIRQSDWKWFLHDRRGNELHRFENGAILKFSDVGTLNYFHPPLVPISKELAAACNRVALTFVLFEDSNVKPTDSALLKYVPPGQGFLSNWLSIVRGYVGDIRKSGLLGTADLVRVA